MKIRDVYAALYEKATPPQRFTLEWFKSWDVAGYLDFNDEWEVGQSGHEYTLNHVAHTAAWNVESSASWLTRDNLRDIQSPFMDERAKVAVAAMASTFGTPKDHWRDFVVPHEMIERALGTLEA